LVHGDLSGWSPGESIPLPTCFYSPLAEHKEKLGQESQVTSFIKAAFCSTKESRERWGVHAEGTSRGYPAY